MSRASAVPPAAYCVVVSRMSMSGCSQVANLGVLVLQCRVWLVECIV